MPIQMSINPTPHKNRTASLLAGGILFAAFSVAPAALAANNPGAHEHGHARLQMAVEENRIDLMFDSPAHNLAGFEHEARTEGEKNQLAEIQRWLETTPLLNTKADNCRVRAAAVELGGKMDAHSEGHHEHDDGHHGHDEHRHEETTHREYGVSQQLECDRIGANEEFMSALMDRFQNLEELTVEWVSPSGQGSARLTPTERTFTFSN